MIIDTIGSNLRILGESPVWCSIKNILYFVDIKKPAIHQLSPHGEIQTFEMPSDIGSIVLTNDGRLLAALRSVIAFVDMNSFIITNMKVAFNEPIGNRFNDAACDERGRYWVATMDDDCIKESGALWRMNSDTQVKRMESNFIVGNGIGWNLKSEKMYFTDSKKKTIFAYSYDLESGSIYDKRVFAKVASGLGYPDGLTVDAQGGVWSAHWDGWCVTRYTPEGDVNRVIQMPIPRSTSLAFGGDNYDKLYVTTASMGLNEKIMSEAPLSGALFVLDVGIEGKADNVFSN